MYSSRNKGIAIVAVLLGAVISLWRDARATGLWRDAREIGLWSDAREIGPWSDAREAEEEESSLMVGSTSRESDSRGGTSCLRNPVLQDLMALLDSSNQGCGAENTTSVDATAKHFASADTERVPFNEMMDLVTFHFRAFDEHHQPRSHGGDELQITAWSWGGNETALKTAAIATDLLDGSYRVSLKLPNAFKKHQLTLHHWYTCFEGYRRDGCVKTITISCNDQERRVFVHDLASFGPVPLDHEQLEAASSVDTNIHFQSRSNLMACENSQYGIDDVTQTGVWWDKKVSLLNAISEDAYWVPLCCRPPASNEVTLNSTPNQVFRVGDSTMPNQFLQIGFPFNPISFYGLWIQQLMNNTELNEAKLTDVMAFQGGLHQIMEGFRPSVTVDILLLMLCQISSVFRGKIVMLGPNPIQQHLYRQVDIRDGDVRLVNALLRRRIIDDHQGNLLDICRHVNLNLSSLLLVPNNENGEVSTNQTIVRKRLRQLFDIFTDGYKQNLSSVLIDPNQETDKVWSNRTLFYRRLENAPGNLTTLFSTRLEHQFLHHMSSMDYEAVYGNRTIWVTDLHTYLLARDEMYRENDKIHDMKGNFFWSRHQKIIDLLTYMRSQGVN